MGLMLGAWRKIVAGDRLLREGGWKPHEKMASPSLTGRRVGIVGLGAIGEATALHPALRITTVESHYEQLIGGLQSGEVDVVIGVPRGGRWHERLNSDAADYGGSGQGNLGAVDASDIPSHGFAHSLEVRLPPLAAVVLSPD